MKKLLIVIVLGIVLSLLSSCVDIKKGNDKYSEYYVRYEMYSDVQLSADYYYVDGVDTVIVHQSEYEFVAQEAYEPFVLYVSTGELMQLFVRGSSNNITTIYKARYDFYIKVSDIDLVSLKPTEIIGGDYATD